VLDQQVVKRVQNHFENKNELGERLHHVVAATPKILDNLVNVGKIPALDGVQGPTTLTRACQGVILATAPPLFRGHMLEPLI
jgi:hypothetical protein